eukprot:CAMPEP_0197897656 /NCGR_PEP_ID=MMETSP1439-20131203/42298_1 /TAXON_ID=66791 /ORGANISM="Gonyaulax spinifera, Strain CCMP409" /LENGTH=529 /DNA_ID=CAMNT_0043518297 /DNA_START=93 /DNA_END=1682 /DNA_ORIENTATION=-
MTGSSALASRWSCNAVVRLVLAVALLPAQARAGGTAVLRLEPTNGGGDKELKKNLPALYAEWSQTATRVEGAPLVRPGADPYGCKRIRRCRGCAIYALQGQCSFAQKARRAEAAGAQLLIVATAADGPPVSMAAAQGRRVFGKSAPRITAVAVSKKAGRQVFLALDRGEPLEVACWKYERPFGDMISEVFMGALAVVLVMLGAWHSVEDLRRPEDKARFNEEVVAVEERSGIQFVAFGSVMLTVLFFFMKYLIYVLLFVFATGAISTTTMLLEPVLAAWCPALRAHRACTLPKRLAEWLGVQEEHTWGDIIAECIGAVLAVSFLMFRNNDDFGWMLQNMIAVMLLLTIQRTLRLPNLKVGTWLLICTFFFDIFWVFLSPYIFKKSVMIEVATGGGTGQSVPMVLKIPALSGDLPGQFKILGLGDIAIPGLLISFLLRHDYMRHSRCCSGYFTAGVIGYTLGLLATFVSLYLMEHGQPALLFLVPGTLVPTCLIGCRKGELHSMWTANYGPEQAPEGYEALEGGEDNKRD